MSPQPEPIITRVDERTYRVSCVPDTVAQAGHWALRVVDRGDHSGRGEGRWAVTHHGECLSDSGRWDVEPSPSHRTDTWLAHHRFDLDTALRLAAQAAPAAVVNGVDPATAIARSTRTR